jgi:16S rRNA (cytosine967-C5)-methyltransferase
MWGAMSDPVREIAFAVLTAVLDKRSILDDALDAAPEVPARDRAAAHRLAAATLRRLGTLDAVLEPYLRREPPQPVRHVLRLGAAGLLLLDTPPHAAVATAVALARSRGLAPFAGLVNAVLRRVAESGVAVLDELDSPRLDTPAWLWSSWGSAARLIAEAHQREAPLDLTVKPGVSIPAEAELLPTGSLRLPSGTRVADLPGYGEGLFWVQDAAAALPARLLRVSAGERVADLCAAPGGKTAQLALTGAEVTAVERDAGRLARLRDNLARLRLDATLVEADALTWSAAEPGSFDAVLVDAPCTATGTIRRHPDVPRLRRPRDVETLAAAQRRLLAAAARLLRPGGRLVYAVCSLQPEEGPAQAASLDGDLLMPDPISPDELPDLPEAVTPDGWLRTHPGLWPERGGMDGFFAARFRRPG